MKYKVFNGLALKTALVSFTTLIILTSSFPQKMLENMFFIVFEAASFTRFNLVLHWPNDS